MCRWNPFNNHFTVCTHCMPVCIHAIILYKSKKLVKLAYLFVSVREEMNEKARELGIDGPLVTKHYGDTHREAALKYKKGVSWAKRWKNLSEEDKRPKFLTTLPDGTSYC